MGKPIGAFQYAPSLYDHGAAITDAEGMAKVTIYIAVTGTYTSEPTRAPYTPTERPSTPAP